MEPYRILVVDDDPVSGTIISKLAAVKQFSWDVKTCSHPAQVFFLFSESCWRPDLAIIDHFMPDLEGPALMNLLKQHGEPMAWVGISSCLAHDLWEGQLPAEAYFTKPITPDILQICDTLAKLARLKSTQSALKSAI